MSGSRRPASGRAPRPRRVVRRRSGPDSRRVLFVLGAVLILLGVVAGRLVYLQAVMAKEYSAKARAQRLRDVTIPPRRGTIYDREGEPLAVSVEAKTIYATPADVRDKAGTAGAIAKTLGMDAAQIEQKLSKDAGFVYIARKVDLGKARVIESLGLAGIGLLDDSKRTYPSGEIGCQVLGFVGVDDAGLAGVERFYDDTLSGTPGTLLAERDPYGRPIPGGVKKSIEPKNGQDVVLTIDKDIQYQAQLELKGAVKEWGAAGGSVIVMNPKTGEIYAMASTPSFDPNAYSKANPKAFRNRALSDAYEPGSTIKSLTAASVIDKGLYNPKSMFVLPPALMVSGKRVGEAHGRPTVRWSLAEIVTHSSNVGAVKLGQALKAKGLYDYFSRFGLTEKTGVDFPGEAIGWLPPPRQWSALSMANIPFGQGVSTTPLQLARAVAAIANEGRLPTPHFLLSLPNEPDAQLSWPTRRAISADAAAQTTEILREVVTVGTGSGAAVPGYQVAGKTGTAQRAREGGRGYESGAYVSSFIGFLPAEDPQVLISVVIDRPSKAIYGGTVAAPVFSKLGQFSVSHLGIPPSPKTPSDDASVTPVPSPAKD